MVVSDASLNTPWEGVGHDAALYGYLYISGCAYSICIKNRKNKKEKSIDKTLIKLCILKTQGTYEGHTHTAQTHANKQQQKQ